MKTGRAAQPTPLEIAAAVPIVGAIDHNNQLTLFGFASPRNIERIYMKVAIKDASAPAKTKYSSISYQIFFHINNGGPARIF